VYDAANMIDGGHEPYLDDLPDASSSASIPNAVATAAHHVLVGLRSGPLPTSPLLLPSAMIARLDGLYGNLTVDDPGVVAGAAAAAAMLEQRAGDGRWGAFRFACGVGVGQWRPGNDLTCPGPTAGDPFAWVADVDPFVVESGSQFRTKGPHGINTGIYAKEYAEVKDLGGKGDANSPTSRTTEQTELAMFFTVNPIELYNRTFRTISEDEELSLVEQARLFGMLNIATADSAITCWDDKAYWSFWRPVTAIRMGNEDGNPRTAGNALWEPLVANPPYPDHPSGYNCVTGAMMNTAAAFFGKKKAPFSLVTTDGRKRDYERFLDVIDDTIDARVYLGIHFRTPDVQGAGIGKDVAHWLDTHHFRPVK
jgi:hypothetical protein